MKQWYEQLFENYANKYEDEVFTKGTLQEVDFLELELNYDKSLKILDIGCGTGRHSIELAKRGYAITGIDLSENMLSKAREKATAANVEITFLRRDARSLDFTEEFDFIIMICEGGFSLMETDEMNYQILQGAANALKKGGTFIFTCLNALFPLANSTQEFLNKNSDFDRNHNNSFDPTTFRDSCSYTHIDDDGNESTLVCNERFYAPSEISWYLKSLHFDKSEIYGCEVGNFSKEGKPTYNDFELLVIGKK